MQDIKPKHGFFFRLRCIKAAVIRRNHHSVKLDQSRQETTVSSDRKANDTKWKSSLQSVWLRCLSQVKSAKSIFVSKRLFLQLLRAQLTSINSFTAQATPVHDVAVENPPSADENEGETCYIPGGDGNIYQVNTAEAMTEDVPYFEPRFSVRLELFTPENPRQAHLIDASNPASLSSSNFSPDRPTRFVTHGWRAGGSLTRPFSEGLLNDHFSCTN